MRIRGSSADTPSTEDASKHCNTLQHTATHCNTLQHTATHCSTLQHTAAHCNTLQHTAHTACGHALHGRQLHYAASYCVNTSKQNAKKCQKLQHTEFVAHLWTCPAQTRTHAVCCSVLQCFDASSVEYDSIISCGVKLWSN